MMKNNYNMLYEEIMSHLYSENSDWDNLITEKIITFNNKRYPPFGQVIFVAGGSGSGKGFQIKNLFGLTGRIYDVDVLKEDIKRNTELRKSLAAQYDVDESVFDMKTPKDVSIVHRIIKSSGLKQKYENNIFNASKIAPPDRKPNLIFDKTFCTFADFYYLVKICTKELGYKKENIHFVWILNDYNVALEQNNARPRKIDKNLLYSIHSDTAKSMKQLLSLGNTIKNYIDGDFWISFNKADVDITVKHGNNNNFVIEKAFTVKIKSAGGDMLSLNEIDKDIINKIKEYIPPESW